MNGSPPILASPCRHRRGAALLIVLAVLVLTVTACTILAQSAATAKLREDLDAYAREADALLPAAEDPIQDWLESKSATVVLDVDADRPRIAVLHDQWMMDDQTCELTVTAWDQCGMVPWRLAKSASPLRLALPVEALARIDQVNIDGTNAPGGLGLDLFIDLVNKCTASSPFPLALDSTAARFGADGSSQQPDDSPSAILPEASPSVAIGGLIGTHNPSAKINVNTAPISLVEAAVRTTGRGGIEQVIAARRANPPHSSPAPTPTPEPASRGHSDEAPQGVPRPTIVSSSDCWSFRIDIRVGSVQRSWWATYKPATPNHSHARKPQNISGVAFNALPSTTDPTPPHPHSGVHRRSAPCAVESR